MARWSTAAMLAAAVLGVTCEDQPAPAEAKVLRHQRAPATSAVHVRAHHSSHVVAGHGLRAGEHRHAASAAARRRHPDRSMAGDSVQTGKASIYAEPLRGRRMADGTRFDPNSDAAASKTLPLGTTARVTNLESGRTATVTVRDRGPRVRGRILDVSPRSGAVLGIKREGVAPVAVAPTADPLAHGH